jgi:hypothetical protein
MKKTTYLLGIKPIPNKNPFKNIISKKIQAFQYYFYSGYKGLKKEELYVHIAILDFCMKDQKYYVYESRFKEGCVKTEYDEWIKRNKNNTIDIVSLHEQDININIELANNIINEKKQYGYSDIKNIVLSKYVNKILNIFSELRTNINLDSNTGYICTEFVLNCITNIDNETKAKYIYPCNFKFVSRLEQSENPKGLNKLINYLYQFISLF